MENHLPNQVWFVRTVSNAVWAFQRFMNDVFADMLDICVVVIHLNNILIYSSDKATHHKQVKEVLRRLQKHGLYAKPEKCEFDRESFEYLSYILSPASLMMATDKVQTIQEWPEPRKVKDIQSFIYNFSDITVPLTRLTWKHIPFVFGKRSTVRLNILKLLSLPLLFLLIGFLIVLLLLKLTLQITP